MQVLDKVMNDTVTFNNLLDHGCWCAKLDPTSDMTMLGGATPIDELDDICRRWFRMRHCNDRLSGGSCHQQPKNDHYEINLLEDPLTCNTHDLDTSVQITDCAYDSCLIDIKYAYEVKDWVESNPSWTSAKVDDYDTCLLPEMMDLEKTCVGQAPNLVINQVVRKAFVPYVIATTEEEVEEMCDGGKFDLTVLVDGSGSVAPSNYAISVDFLENLLAPMDISPTETRVTVAQFSREVTVYCTMCDDRTSVDNAVTALRNGQDRSVTMTGYALKTMYDLILANARSGVPQVHIIITDGISTNGLVYNGFDSTQEIYNAGIWSFAIGVGGGTSQDELLEIATDPDSEHMWDLSNFDALEQVRLAASSKVCQTSGTSNSITYKDGNNPDNYTPLPKELQTTVVKYGYPQLGYGFVELDMYGVCVPDQMDTIGCN